MQTDTKERKLGRQKEEEEQINKQKYVINLWFKSSCILRQQNRANSNKFNSAYTKEWLKKTLVETHWWASLKKYMKCITCIITNLKKTHSQSSDRYDF